MKTSPRGLALIKQFEGFREDAYRDIVGVWTIGYGFTKGVQPGDHMTREEADARLYEELASEGYESAVRVACAPQEPNQNQFDAMVCLAWNIGVTGFKKSTVVKAHNRQDFAAAARAFSLWNKAGGKVVNGLVRRRAAEAALYLEPIMDTEPMPQRVDAEASFTSSNINKAGIVTAATASAGTVVEALNTISAIKQGVDGLREWVVPILLLAVVGLAVYIVWQRIDMRKRGVA